MLCFDAFVEDCFGVCFARCLADRFNVVECLAKISWLAKSQVVVTGRQEEVVKPKIDR